MTHPLGPGEPTRAYVLMYAAGDASRDRDEFEEVGVAEVLCSTGDDSCALIRQRTVLSDDRVYDWGVVDLHQQETRIWRHETRSNPVAIMRMDRDGLAELDVKAFAPMQRAREAIRTAG